MSIKDLPFEERLQMLTQESLTDKSSTKNENLELKRARFTRKDKNAPREVSSKKQVSRSRNVVEVEKQPSKSLDPRFNSLTGFFNPDLFQKSYGFLKEMEEKEIEELKKRIVTTRDATEKDELKQCLQSILSKKFTLEREEKRQEIKRKWRKSEMEAVKEGKNPFYLKKSEFKKLELVEKFKGMDKNRIDKLLEKKRKRNAAQERKFIPKKRSI